VEERKDRGVDGCLRRKKLREKRIGYGITHTSSLFERAGIAETGGGGENEGEVNRKGLANKGSTKREDSVESRVQKSGKITLKGGGRPLVFLCGGHIN